MVHVGGFMAGMVLMQLLSYGTPVEHQTDEFLGGEPDDHPLI